VFRVFAYCGACVNEASSDGNVRLIVMFCELPFAPYWCISWLGNAMLIVKLLLLPVNSEGVLVVLDVVDEAPCERETTDLEVKALAVGGGLVC